MTLEERETITTHIDQGWMNKINECINKAIHNLKRLYPLLRDSDDVVECTLRDVNFSLIEALDIIGTITGTGVHNITKELLNDAVALRKKIVQVTKKHYFQRGDE